MTMLTATYPGMGEDPAWDSREVRKELTPIVHRLRLLLEDLERVVDAEDDTEDDGHHGD
jgi:hypothetical protein